MADMSAAVDEQQEVPEQALDHRGAIRALSKVRREAAATRLRIQQAEALLAGSRTSEGLEAELDSIREAGRVANHPLLVENVALRFGLPEELAEALKGDTRGELEAHARVLARFAPVN
ncbi:hypothetical protein GCM10023350_06380 [Nocardioides endophyticus]|uniref:DUF222 domain-containing protein n=1 Tax=Nocardioides endophyticus TaxID=1353775 RepID=A0ABP8YDP6_9ACTN